MEADSLTAPELMEPSPRSPSTHPGLQKGWGLLPSITLLMYQTTIYCLKFLKLILKTFIYSPYAYLLSSELPTLLSGRYTEIKMLPLSSNRLLSAAFN